MFNDNDYLRRLIHQQGQRIAALERELRGLRSERRPRQTSKRQLYKAVVSEPAGIAYNGSGQVTIYLGGVATTWQPTAHLKWMHGNKNCSFGAEVLVHWFTDENRFDIINGECEP